LIGTSVPPILTPVYWVRHGENTANLSRRFSYRVFDGDLTDRGVAQAQELTRALRVNGRHYGLLVCSPLRRAQQTARIVSAGLGLPIEAELEDLREVNVGDLDGRNDEAAWDVYGAVLERWRSGHLETRFPGGESGGELAARMERALQTVAGRAGSSGAVIIAHGANIRAAIPTLTGQPDPGIDLATGGIARFTVAAGPRSGSRVTLEAWT